MFGIKETKSMKEVAKQLSTLRVLAFAVLLGVFTFLSVLEVSLSPTLAQQQTTNNTAAGEIPETAELPQQLLMTVIVDDEPLYQSISSNRTSMRVVDVCPSVVIQEVSYIEKAFMKNIGNVTNTATFVDNISRDGTIIVHGVGKGIITTENGDTVSWNAYGLALPAGYGYGINNDTGTNTTAADNGLNNTEKITIYRGIIFFSTDSERLSFMNNLVGLYISQVNEENGTSLRQIWEWRNNY